MHFLFADAMKEDCDPCIMSFMGQTPILFLSLPSVFLETNVFEEQHDRIVPGAAISEENGAVLTYQCGLRAVNGESATAPDLLEHFCSYRRYFCHRVRVLPG
jgi:hypothetical protein